MCATDTIRLRGLRFYGRHGVVPAETTLGQRFIVDVTLGLDLRLAGEDDDLTQTVDYGAVYAAVRDVVEGPPFRLIEAVAERIAGRLLEEHPRVTSVRVRVGKPGAPVEGVLKTVEIEITRERG